jgi:hypothetical protein
MSCSLPYHDLYHVVDVPEVESSIFAHVAQFTLLAHQLWHRTQGQANQDQTNINVHQSIPEPTTEGTGLVGIDTDAPLIFSAALPDDAFD